MGRGSSVHSPPPSAGDIPPPPPHLLASPSRLSAVRCSMTHLGLRVLRGGDQGFRFRVLR